MKKFINLLMLFLASFNALAASNSNPGLYYGQVPTAAQWNSYFSSKLDYSPGAANTLPYWDGSGNLLAAPVTGGCSFAAGVFTCSPINLAGGATGSVPYQSATDVTAFLAGNTTTTPQFYTSTGTGAVALAPTLTGSTGTGSVVLAGSPTVTGTLSAANVSASGSILSTGVGGIGYGTGSGGTVTQLTSKTTAVTLNKLSGQITMNNAALGAGWANAVQFACNNSTVGAYDTVVVSKVGPPGVLLNYDISTYVAAGVIYFGVINNTAGSLSEAIVFNFQVIKGSIN